MMEIKNYIAYNPNAEIEINLNEMIKRFLKGTESVLKYLMEVKPEIMTEYISAFKKRLANVVKDIDIDTSLFNLNEVSNDLTLLNDYLELQKLIAQFIFKHLDLPKGYQPESEKIVVFNLNHTKAGRRLSYHRVKAFVDVLGKEDGVQLYKQILAKIVDEDVKNSNYQRKTQRESCELAIKRWIKTGLGDFTACFYDDYKVLFRFDRCVVHEALKDLKDPDIAYLASCYRGDVQGPHPGKFWRMRRTQTLHHGDFCDELYWYEDIHPNLEQPPLEFTKNIGKEMKKR